MKRKPAYLLTIAVLSSSSLLAQVADPAANQRRSTLRPNAAAVTPVLTRPGAPLARDYSKPMVMTMQSPSVNPSLMLAPVQMSGRALYSGGGAVPQLVALPGSPAASPTPATAPDVISPVVNTVPNLPALVNPVLPVITPVITPVLPVVTPIIPNIVTPVLPIVTPIVTPVVNPVLPVVNPIITPVINPVLPVVTPLLPIRIPGLLKGNH